MTEAPVWAGTNPYVLVIEPKDPLVEPLVVDLDESQWMKTHDAYLRIPGMWHLVGKDLPARRLLSVLVLEGDRPYHAFRHVGLTGGGGSNEITAYGIGKKQADGTIVNLWLMPNGTVCGGDDVGELGVAMVRRLGPRG